MKTNHSLVSGLALILVLGWAAAARGEASAPERARPHVEAGQTAFGNEEYAPAIIEFQAAYDLLQDPMLLYNIAVCHERLHHRREAVDAYFRYLTEAPHAENAGEVQTRIDRLQHERVEERDREVEVSAVDGNDEEGPLANLRRTQLEESHHELGLLVGTNLVLYALAADRASWSLVMGYHYRLTPHWHVGGEILMDWYGERGDSSHQGQYGLVAGGRWAAQLGHHFEIHVQAGLGYQLLSGAHNHYDHWILMRLGSSVVWDVYRGFGFRISINTRLGFLTFPAPDQFGLSLDISGGLFWAI